MASSKDIARVLLDRHGTTYAEQANIRLRDAPAPLYQLLVLSMLLSARISADLAVAAARELFKAGYRSPRAMRDATWQDRVDALGRGHYRRYDERTATMLGDGAELVLERWKGDLRRLHAEGADSQGVTSLLQEVPGIGPTGASIFCREVQSVWPSLAPYVDSRTIKGAERVGLPTTPNRLAALVSKTEIARLAAACVRASLSKEVADDVRNAL
jgi:hypothetical protein